MYWIEICTFYPITHSVSVEDNTRIEFSKAREVNC